MFGQTIQIKAIVLIPHEGLISVLEYGEVLELDEEHRDVSLVYEETGKKHEGDDQDWGKCDGELLV